MFIYMYMCVYATTCSSPLGWALVESIMALYSRRPGFLIWCTLTASTLGTDSYMVHVVRVAAGYRPGIFFIGSLSRLSRRSLVGKIQKGFDEIVRPPPTPFFPHTWSVLRKQFRSSLPNTFRERLLPSFRMADRQRRNDISGTEVVSGSNRDRARKRIISIRANFA